jgi:hypothetical protein
VEAERHPYLERSEPTCLLKSEFTHAEYRDRCLETAEVKTACVWLVFNHLSLASFADQFPVPGAVRQDRLEKISLRSNSFFTCDR